MTPSYKICLFIIWTIHISIFNSVQFAQVPILVSDINNSESTQHESRAVANINGTTLLIVHTYSYGQELWVTDGTEPGTTLLFDINPNGDSHPFGFVEFDGYQYFTAYDGSVNAIWRTDGSTTGTIKLKDLAISSPSFSHFHVFNNMLLMAINDSTYGKEVFTFSPSDSSLTLLKDINAGNPGSNPVFLANFNNDFYFTASDNISGAELWKTDGSESGTVLLKDINPGFTSSFINSPTVANGQLFFVANDGVHYYELWATDGTTPGTHLVIDLDTTLSGQYYQLTELNDSLFFIASDGDEKYGLWRTDGSANGTTLIKRLNTSGGLIPDSYQVYGEYFYFKTYQYPDGAKIWHSNGTTLGTEILHELNSSDFIFKFSISYNGCIFFAMPDSVAGYEIFSLDTTNSSLTLLKDFHPANIYSRPTGLFIGQDQFYFSADHGLLGKELWTSDGTNAGTQLLKNINRQTQSSNINLFPSIDSLLFFQARKELYRSDGSTAGTILIHNTDSNVNSIPDHIIASNETILFSGLDESNQRELWKTTGHLDASQIVKNLNGLADGDPTGLFHHDTVTFFWANDSLLGRTPWISDGTSAGTQLLKNLTPHYLSEFVLYNNYIFFSADDASNGLELWKSDGTESGTVLVKDINPSGGSHPRDMVVFNDTLFFVAYEPSVGLELWKSDGTESGTQLVKDISANQFTGPGNLTVFKDALYMTDEQRIWRSDGTTAGTHIFFAGVPFRTAYGLVPADSILYFHVESNGLWRTLPSDTVTKIRDFRNEAIFNTDFLSTIAVDSFLYFNALDSMMGEELWISDGTDSGTMSITNINPQGDATPRDLTVWNHFLYFSANDGFHGSELWKLRVKPRCFHPDFTALAQLFDLTNGPNWTNNTGWLTDCDPCNWYGITCDGNGRVIDIILQVNNLTGPLPQEITQLTYLRNLHLGVNNITGSIPIGLGALVHMQNLWLHNNNLSDTIPADIGNSNALQRIYFNNNVDLEGSIPSSFGDISSLLVLRTYNTALSGCYLANLERLCNQLGVFSTNENISVATNLDASWEDFCICNVGICACNEVNSWQGGVGNWNVATNWSLGHVPRACETVLITGASDVVTLPTGVSVVVYLIEVNNGAELIVSIDQKIHVLADPGFSEYTSCD